MAREPRFRRNVQMFNTEDGHRRYITSDGKLFTRGYNAEQHQEELDKEQSGMKHRGYVSVRRVDNEVYFQTEDGTLFHERENAERHANELRIAAKEAADDDEGSELVIEEPEDGIRRLVRRKKEMLDDILGIPDMSGWSRSDLVDFATRMHEIGSTLERDFESLNRRYNELKREHDEFKAKTIAQTVPRKEHNERVRLLTNQIAHVVEEKNELLRKITELETKLKNWEALKQPVHIRRGISPLLRKPGFIPGNPPGPPNEGFLEVEKENDLALNQNLEVLRRNERARTWTYALNGRTFTSQMSPEDMSRIVKLFQQGDLSRQGLCEALGLPLNEYPEPPTGLEDNDNPLGL